MRAFSPADETTTIRLFTAFLRLGATAFGGPASVARMREMAVVRRQWLAAEDFEQGLALCQMLPGATAMQCAAFIGLRLHGLVGAVATFIGFGLPAFLIMLAASMAYVHALPRLGAQGIFAGLRIAVVAIIANATLDFGRAQIKTKTDGLLVGLVAILMLLRGQPVLVVIAAMLLGVLLARKKSMPSPTELVPVNLPRLARQLGLILLGMVGLMTALLVLSPGLATLALTMMKIDVAAFGGGFAALPLMYDEFVFSRGAVSALALMDGIALGQVTPGPIVITATFIGYQVAGLLGGLVATVGIFIPSFTLVIASTPWFQQLQRYGRVRAATKTAALAFVGLLVSATYQMGQSVPWNVMHVLLVLATFLALRKRMNVILVMVLAAVVEGILSVCLR
jgi:chromate transporter